MNSNDNRPVNSVDTRLVHVDECECLAWKPVIAGAFVGVGLTFLLNLFSVAIGLTAYKVDTQGGESLVFGGFIGAGIGVIAAMFAAGWLSGYLGRKYCVVRHMGALYGFLTWCVALVIAVFFAGAAQHYVGDYSHFLSGTPAGVVDAASNAAVGVVADGSLVISAYIVFALFFLGAFAASLGGHCGMRHLCKKTNC